MPMVHTFITSWLEIFLKIAMIRLAINRPKTVMETIKMVIQNIKFKHLPNPKFPFWMLERMLNKTIAKISSKMAIPMVNCANGCCNAFCCFMIGMATMVELMEKIAPKNNPKAADNLMIRATVIPKKNHIQA